jgi:hypothetical protein
MVVAAYGSPFWSGDLDTTRGAGDAIAASFDPG